MYINYFSLLMEGCSFTCISKLYDIYKERIITDRGRGSGVGKIFIFFFILLQSSRTTGQDGECEFADSPAPLQRHQGAAPLRPRAVWLLPPVCCRGGGPRKPDSHTSAIHQVGVRDCFRNNSRCKDIWWIVRCIWRRTCQSNKLVFQVAEI